MSPLPRFLVSSLLVGALAAAPVARAAYDFGAWPAGTAPQEVGKRIAEEFVPRAHGNTNYNKTIVRIIYPEACAWYGALMFAAATKDTALQEKLAKRFEPLFREEAKLVPVPEHVDYTMFAAVPLELYIQTKEQRYLAMGEWMAYKQWSEPFGRNATPEAYEFQKQGYTWQTRLWIDDMFMITVAQVQAFRATGNKVYLDRAAKETVLYLDKLQQPNGLFHHSPEVPFFWGRGDGWVAAGMSILLREMPADHPDRARIMKGYKLMMESLLKFQDANGMWRQLIDDAGSWPETSGSAMFTFAFISGVKEGWLDGATYGPAARKGWIALVGYLDEHALLRDVCEGTNKKNDRQHYLDRQRFTGDLHGQSPMLWCATELLR